MVRLVSVTAPVDASHAPNAEALIAYCARVSSPHRQEDHESAGRLLRYLVEHKHWSPFEMVDMTVEITTSRAIAAQMLRHRSFVFQEFSQRYASVADLGFEHINPRRQDTKNRQASHDDLPDHVRDWFLEAMRSIQGNAEEMYEQALCFGVAKETARFLLPLSTTTRLYMKGSVRSWIHYLEARTDSSTQKEHRVVAEDVLCLFTQQFPTVAEAVWGGGVK